MKIILYSINSRIRNYVIHQANQLDERYFESNFKRLVEVLYGSYQRVVVLILEQMLDQRPFVDASQSYVHT